MTREDWLKKMCVTNYRLYVELTFDGEGSNKPMHAVTIMLSQFVDGLNGIDPEAKIVKHKSETKNFNGGVFVDENEIMK